MCEGAIHHRHGIPKSLNEEERKPDEDRDEDDPDQRSPAARRGMLYRCVGNRRSRRADRRWRGLRRLRVGRNRLDIVRHGRRHHRRDARVLSPRTRGRVASAACTGDASIWTRCRRPGGARHAAKRRRAMCAGALRRPASSLIRRHQGNRDPLRPWRLGPAHAPRAGPFSHSAPTRPLSAGLSDGARSAMTACRLWKPSSPSPASSPISAWLRRASSPVAGASPTATAVRSTDVFLTTLMPLRRSICAK